MARGIPIGLRISDGAAAGNGVSCVSTPSLTDLTAGMVWVWALTPSVANTARNLVAKNVGTPGGWELFKRGTDGTAVRFARYRNAGQALTMDSPTGTLMANVPFFLAATFDINNTANCRMYRGTLNTPAVELSLTTVAGTGAGGTDAAQPVIIGNSTSGSQGWPGVIWAVGVSRQTNYSLTEIRQIQYQPYSFRNPVGMWVLSEAPVRDWSGNGATGTLIGSGKLASECLPMVNVA